MEGRTPGSATRAVVSVLGGRRATALSLRADADALLDASSWDERLMLVRQNPHLIDPAVARWCALNGNGLLADLIRRSLENGLDAARQELVALNRFMTALRIAKVGDGGLQEAVRELVGHIDTGSEWLIPHLWQALSAGDQGSIQADSTHEVEAVLASCLARNAGLTEAELATVRRWAEMPLGDAGRELLTTDTHRRATWHAAADLQLALDAAFRPETSREGISDIDQLTLALLSGGRERALTELTLVIDARTAAREMQNRDSDDVARACRQAALSCLRYARDRTAPWIAQAAHEAGLRNLDLTPHAHPLRAQSALVAGLVVELAVDARVHEPADLADAIQLLQQAYDDTDPTARGDHAAALSAARANAIRRGLISRDASRSAAELAREAFDLTDDGDPGKASRAASLGTRWTDCITWGTSDTSTPRLALEAHETALALTFPRDPARPQRANNLANAIANAVRLGVLNHEELRRAYELQEEAYLLTDELDAARAGRASNLGNRIVGLAQNGMTPSTDLARALKLHQESVAKTPEGDQAKPGRIANVAATLAEMVQVGQADPIVLAEAVRLDREALSLTVRDDPRRAMRLANLGNRLAEAVAVGLEDADVLGEALEVRAEAYDLTAPDHMDRARYASNLAAAIFEAHHHDLVPDALLLDAVNYLREARHTATNDAARARYAANLGALMAQAISSGVMDQSHLPEAVRHQRESVTLTPPGDPRLASRRANLANRLFQAALLNYEPATSVGDAIGLTVDAYRSTPTSHPDHVGHLANLALRWSEVILHGLEVDGMSDLASELLDAIWDRMRGALAYQQRARHLEHLTITSASLPLAVLKTLGSQEAVAAVEALRGHLAGAMSSPRLPEGLVDPALESEYRKIASSYDRSQAHARDGMIDPDYARIARTDLDKAIAGLRAASPALQRFGARPTFHELQSVLHDGEAAIYLLPSPRWARPATAVGEQSSGQEGTPASAIVVRKGSEPEAIALTLLTNDSIERAVTALRRTRAAAHEVCAWLWNVVIDPLLASPSATDGVSEWILIPSGQLAGLPLHAAGSTDHGWVDERVTVRVVSSLSSLASAEGEPAAGPDVVAVAESPDLPFLDADRAVARDILAPSQVREPATADGTLTSLVEARRAVLSGHAVQSLREGAGLAFRSHPPGSIEPTRTWLTAEAVERLPHRQREWVFLSACSTAQTAIRTPDEAIGLPSALLKAGFRSVVATSWPVADHVAFVTLARFRDVLSSRDAGSSTAEVLRDVQQWLRTADRVQLTDWMESLSRNIDLPAQQVGDLCEWWNICPEPAPYADPQDWAAYFVTGH